MLKLKKDFECILRDVNTGVDLLRFTAQQIGDPTHNASFVGGGVASAGQAFSIEVEKAYDLVKSEYVTELGERLTPLAQQVIIDGCKWMLTSWNPSIRRRQGVGWAKPRKVYILNLE